LIAVKDPITVLRGVGLQPTPQRLAVARYVLDTTSHPTADEILEHARQECPTLSRATVYNTLARLTAARLVRPQAIKEGVVVFDARLEKHHHFIDEETGEIHDVPWDALVVSGKEKLKGFEVREYQVVMRGRRRRP
jgi:Fur family peroxide stress response transcriptional regulator